MTAVASETYVYDDTLDALSTHSRTDVHCTVYDYDEQGLSDYGYRHYAPELGRWVSRDPIGERGGRNVYATAGNIPIGRIDFLGYFHFGSDCKGYMDCGKSYLAFLHSNPDWNEIIKRAEDRGCRALVAGCCCSSRDRGYVMPPQPDGDTAVVLCCNNMKGTRIYYTLAHELVHFLQRCVRKDQPDPCGEQDSLGDRAWCRCKEQLCLEWQAYVAIRECPPRDLEECWRKYLRDNYANVPGWCGLARRNGTYDEESLKQWLSQSCHSGIVFPPVRIPRIGR